MRQPRNPRDTSDQNEDVPVPKRGYVRYPLCLIIVMGPSWDPSSLVLGDVASRQGAKRKGRQISSVRGKFIAGPIDVVWLSRARKLGVSALWVGLALWFLKG